jgi:hypothetical protein
VGGGGRLNFSEGGFVVTSKQHQLKCMNSGNTAPCILQHQIKQCSATSGTSRCNPGTEFGLSTGQDKGTNKYPSNTTSIYQKPNYCSMFRPSAAIKYLTNRCFWRIFFNHFTIKPTDALISKSIHVHVSGRIRMELQFHPDPARKLSSNLYNMCQCRMYSGKFLMMGRETARNM